jgi:hypothetical protein
VVCNQPSVTGDPYQKKGLTAVSAARTSGRQGKNIQVLFRTPVTFVNPGGF